MWFIWIGNVITALVNFFISKFSGKVVKFGILIPLSTIYVTLMISSFALFVFAITEIINNIFNLIDTLNSSTNNTSSTPVFKCFYYLLDSIGIADSLVVFISLLVSNILAIVTLQATMAGRNQVKKIIELFRNL